jgi:hypothetical protein
VPAFYPGVLKFAFFGDSSGRHDLAIKACGRPQKLPAAEVRSHRHIHSVCRPYGSNRQKRCPKSSATSIGLRLRTLATIAERISHSHPALAVAGATRIERHCGTCGDRDATDFFCSALPVAGELLLRACFLGILRPATILRCAILMFFSSITSPLWPGCSDQAASVP